MTWQKQQESEVPVSTKINKVKSATWNTWSWRVWNPCPLPSRHLSLDPPFNDILSMGSMGSSDSDSANLLSSGGHQHHLWQSGEQPWSFCKLRQRNEIIRSSGTTLTYSHTTFNSSTSPSARLVNFLLRVKALLKSCRLWELEQFEIRDICES